MNAFRRQSSAIVFASMAVLAACAGNDSALADSADGSAAAGDSTMAGMDHSAMPGMNNGPARDADHEFLRKMSDHHEGLVVMMNGAMAKASSAAAKADARVLHDTQRTEKNQMVGLIKSAYDETYMPMEMQSAKAMTADLGQKSGAAYDRAMYGHVVMHHEEAIKMIDDFLPRMQKAEVKRMAEKMRVDQQREIQDFKRKRGG